MEINSGVYPSINSWATIEYSHSILELESFGYLPYDIPWDNSNCYTGYKGLDGLVCSHPSSGTISNRFNFAAKGEPYIVNLRPMWKDRLDGTQPIPTLTQKWTGEETLPSFNSFYGCGTWYPITKFNVNDLCFLVIVQVLEKSSGQTISMYYDDLLNNYPKKLVENGYNDDYIITGMELTPYYYFESRDYRSRCNIFFVAEVITSTGIFYTIPIGESIGNVGSFYADYVNYNFRDNSFTYTPGVVENRTYSGELILTKVSDNSNLYYTQVSNNSNIDFSAIAIGDYVVQDNVWAHRRTETNVFFGSCWNKEKIEKSVSALGCYWSGTRNSAITSPLGKDCTDPLIRLGVIDPADGMTDGSYVTGTAVADEPQSDWDDFADNEYTPSRPEIKEESDPIRVDYYNSMLENASVFTTSYLLNSTLLEDASIQLWRAPETFWAALRTASNTVNQNIFDYIVGLKAFPFDLSQYIYTTNTDELYFGTGAKLAHSAAISSPYKTTKDLVADLSYTFGMKTVAKKYDNFLDYDPFTQVSIYLPYCGTFPLNAREVMGKSIGIHAVVDIQTGVLTYEVYNNSNEYPILIKQCQVGMDIAITGNDSSQMSSNIVNAVLTSTASIAKPIAQIGQSMISGGATGGVIGAVAGAATALPELAGSTIGAALDIAQASREIPISSGTTVSFGATAYGQEAYLIIRRPIADNPESFGHTVGNYVNKAAEIKNISGFTICNNVDTSGIIATEKERNQIKSILESGFYA